MSAVRNSLTWLWRILVLVVSAAAVLIHPHLFPFAAVGVGIPLILWIYDRRRERTPAISVPHEQSPGHLHLERAPGLRDSASRSRRASIAGFVVVAVAVGILTAGILSSQTQYASIAPSERHGEPRPTPTPGPVTEVPVTYDAHLQFGPGHSEGLLEEVSIANGYIDPHPKADRYRALTLRRLFREEGWRPLRIGFNATVFGRSARREWPYATVLPAQQAETFAPPSMGSVVAGKGSLLLAYSDRSKVVLDAPSNAIGTTFPQAESEQIPSEGERLTLALPQFSHPIRFDVRSGVFRHWPLFAFLAMTNSALFAILLALIPPLSFRRVRKKMTGAGKWLLGKVHA
jgi:hypothetical protein